jgi:hypothetical protein
MTPEYLLISVIWLMTVALIVVAAIWKPKVPPNNDNE